MTLLEQILQLVEQLPPEKQREVLDFVVFLRERLSVASSFDQTFDDGESVISQLDLSKTRRPRKAGNAKGMVKMSDDFDVPLGDFAEYMP